MSADVAAGFTVADLARRWRIGPDKIRSLIAAGELDAINTASRLCGKPRFIVLPEAVAEFEQRRKAGPPPKAPPKRKRRCGQIDYFPDCSATAASATGRKKK
jgi:hypothetical protein